VNGINTQDLQKGCCSNLAHCFSEWMFICMDNSYPWLQDEWLAYVILIPGSVERLCLHMLLCVCEAVVHMFDFCVEVLSEAFSSTSP